MTKYTRCVPKDALPSLDRVNTAIINSRSVEDMLSRALAEILDIFDCDRAMVTFPCIPEATSVQIRAAVTRPGYELDSFIGRDNPIDENNRGFLNKISGSDLAVRFDPLCNASEQQGSLACRQLGALSQLAMQLCPTIGLPWALSFHHCTAPVVYDRATELFTAIGSRIADGLTTHLTLQRLRESEQRYRALVDSAAEAIVILDAEAVCFVDANPAATRLYGLPAEKLVNGPSPFDLSPEFQPDGRRSVDKGMALIMEALAGRAPIFEWMHRRADGTEVPCEISLVRFPDPSRQLLRASITDITERKAAERHRAGLETRLAQAQRLETVGQMTGGVAHDFNNLLSVILGNLELLQDNFEGADQQDMIEKAIHATLRGADLTRKMLSYARRAPLDPTVLDLNVTLSEMDNWMRRTLPANIDIDLQLGPRLWPVEADRASTESAILNLIINARDAMPRGGALTVKTANTVFDDRQPKSVDLSPGTYVVLTVRDTGTGIPENDVERVFEPFFTTKDPGESSGLGLSMVHGFMNQTGGAVRITSEPGRGTSVSLFFPTASNFVAGTELAPPVRPADAPGGPHRLLFAEDQKEVAEILVRILRSEGFEVVAAPDGDTAFQQYFANGPFDLLVTDIMMPGTLQGPALARALREAKPDLPVVFLSGYASGVKRKDSALREEDIRVMKPVTRARLLDAVRTALKPKAG
ncbi:MAG: response regulator [Rhodobacteraceae bacterium]|nr:response regulator [Paracoccaceae bacterium]